jgi:hypothetical protein
MNLEKQFNTKAQGNAEIATEQRVVLANSHSADDIGPKSSIRGEVRSPIIPGLLTACQPFILPCPAQLAHELEGDLISVVQ